MPAKKLYALPRWGPELLIEHRAESKVSEREADSKPAMSSPVKICEMQIEGVTY